jgi:hypothetical protein
MISGHFLLADWLFLFSWIAALLLAVTYLIPERLPDDSHKCLLPLAVAFLAAGLWVL